MAGGFTEFASIKTAQLVRRSVEPREIELERLESSRGGVSAEDSLYYYLETELRIRKEIVNVDFERLFMEGDSAQDVMLRDNDVITIPQRRKTVYVFGQVATPGHIPFSPNQNVDYYLEKAGGLTDRARDGDIKIVKAKTRQWLSEDLTTIEEGDYVWVPKEIERPFGYYLNIVGQTAAIISVGISLALLVIQTKK
jgi:protein involved in polysaccharide export with SLBB domain